MITCELCSHEVEEEMIELLVLEEAFGRGEVLFWACPDCVRENELESKKNQDTPKD